MGAAGFNMPRMKNSVCYQCTKRVAGCHSECKEYLDARNERYQEWQARADAAKKENIVSGFKANAVRKSAGRKPTER